MSSFLGGLITGSLIGVVVTLLVLMIVAGKNHASITAAMPAAAIPLLDPPSFAINKTESKSASRMAHSLSPAWIIAWPWRSSSRDGRGQHSR